MKGLSYCQWNFFFFFFLKSNTSFRQKATNATIKTIVKKNPTMSPSVVRKATLKHMVETRTMDRRMKPIILRIPIVTLG